VDRHRRILALEAHPRSLAALFGWVLSHVVVLLENLMGAVIGDRETLSNAEDVRDDDCASAEALA